MPIGNSVTVKDMAAPMKNLKAGRVATGISLGKLQYFMLVDSDATAPHFTPDQEPNADGRTYRSVDGHIFYRPQLRVAQRSGSVPGPEVRFLKDADGIVRLMFELEESRPAGAADTARPFNIKVDEAVLQWKDEAGKGRNIVFAQPMLTGANEAGASKSPCFSIQAGTQLGPDDVTSVYNAMNRPESQAVVRVTLSYGYWTDTMVPGGPVTRDKEPTIAGKTGGGPVVMRRNGLAFSDIKLASAAKLTHAAFLNKTAISTGGLKVEKLDLDAIRKIMDKAKGREKQTDFHTVRIERSVPFVFNKEMDANKPIYAAISGGKSLADEWMDNAYGFICVSPYPNTVYRLPDEFRLVYSTDLGTPYMIPNLYTAANDESRVRVTLGVVPWHDPEKVSMLADSLRVSSGGELACPNIIVGGYEKATMKFFSAFPEGLSMLSGQEGASINIKDGFQVTFDLSMGFYRFLAQLLTGPIGLSGEVEITLKTRPASDGGQPQEIVRRVPIKLNFRDLAGIPVDIQVPQDAVSPGKVSLINRALSDVKIGKCITRLLQVDDNSVLPLDVFEATSMSPAFPVSLQAGEMIEVGIKPENDGDNLFWNAVQVEPAGQELLMPPEKMLDRVYELAPDPAVTWTVNALCPVFERTPLPDTLKNLYGVRVKIMRPKYAPVVIFLTPSQKSKQQPLERTLSDILGDDAQNLTAFNYQVQNVYFDHEGKWGAEKTNEGSDLFVFPNPVDAD
jgi:hypothetical protein